MKKYRFLLAAFLLPCFVTAQTVFEVRWTTANVPYRAALILWENNSGKMRVKYSRNSETIVVEESVRGNYTEDGVGIYGRDAVYPGSATEFPNYAPDNFFISKDAHGNLSILNIDDGLRFSDCSMQEVKGTDEVQLFLSDFDWKLD
jgi:hypothetical protein